MRIEVHDLDGVRPATADEVAGQGITPAGGLAVPRQGLRVDPIYELPGGVLQVGTFNEAGVSAAPVCEEDRVPVVHQLNTLARTQAAGVTSGHTYWMREAPEPPHGPVPSAACVCGHHYTDSPVCAEFVLLPEPYKHPVLPLRGYALTAVRAEGDVYPGACDDDPEGTWRAERLVIDGPMWLDIPVYPQSLLERLRARYPMARRGWLGRPNRVVSTFAVIERGGWLRRATDEEVSTGRSRDATAVVNPHVIRESLLGIGKQFVATGGRLHPDDEPMVLSAAAWLQNHQAERAYHGLWRIGHGLLSATMGGRGPEGFYAACRLDPQFRAEIPECLEWGPPPALAVAADQSLAPEVAATMLTTLEYPFGWA